MLKKTIKSQAFFTIQKQRDKFLNVLLWEIPSIHTSRAFYDESHVAITKLSQQPNQNHPLSPPAFTPKITLKQIPEMCFKYFKHS